MKFNLQLFADGSDTYKAVGNVVDDVVGLVTGISPEETPLYSMMPDVKVKSTSPSWLEKSLRAAKVNKTVEGGALTSEGAKQRAEHTNYTQIFQQGYFVTGTQEEVAKLGGITSDMDEAMGDALKELALDIELAILTEDTPAAGTASTERVAGGLMAFISTNKMDNSAVTRAYTEALLKEAIQKSWVAGGVPKLVVQSGDNQNIANGFKGGNLSNIDAKSKIVPAAVDKYQSSFGTVTYLPHRQMLDTDVFVLDTQYLQTGYMRRFKDELLPKTYDKITRNILGELTFIVKAEKAQSWITDLNT